MNVAGLLIADGPHPDHVDDLMLYGQFVGTWRVDNTYVDPNGGQRAEVRWWRFDWALGGRGVIDVIVPEDASPDEYGVTLRSYDSVSRVWHLYWMRPSDGQFAPMTGRAVGSGIVQDGSEGDDAWRWTFTDIEQDSFIWRGFSSPDGGVSWTQTQEMYAQRSTGAPLLNKNRARR